MNPCRHSRVARNAVLLLVIGLAPGACQGPANLPGQATGEVVSYADHIQPMLTAKCVSCHQEGGLADLVGIALRATPGEAHDSMVNQPSVQDPTLMLIVPGDAEASLIYQKVSSDSPPVGMRMPSLGAPLTSDELALLRDWINQGALDN
ncbi:MAG: hypothetical protein HOP29_02810 [Phycisphaerales bacterium]|nr:hypothetical protein [Phycisphaerales bacterium]